MFTTLRTQRSVAMATPPPAPRVVVLQGTEATSALLTRLFRSFDGSLALRLWNGTTLRLGTSASDLPTPPFTLVCRSPAVVGAMVLGRDRLRLVESYFLGEIDIEGDFFAALRLKDHLNSLRLSLLDRVRAVFSTLRLPASRATPPATAVLMLHGQAVRAHSKAENQQSIQFHYDVSNKFYALWLDYAMVYSCAYFEHPNDSLEQAQRAKLDHICRKLRLVPGDRLLDIGCGWGALVIHAAEHFGVHAHGVTISKRQLELARQRIAQAGLEDGSGAV